MDPSYVEIVWIAEMNYKEKGKLYKVSVSEIMTLVDRGDVSV